MKPVSPVTAGAGLAQRMRIAEAGRATSDFRAFVRWRGPRFFTSFGMTQVLHTAVSAKVKHDTPWLRNG
jgi:hypothetical protein